MELEQRVFLTSLLRVSNYVFPRHDSRPLEHFTGMCVPSPRRTSPGSTAPRSPSKTTMRDGKEDTRY